MTTTTHPAWCDNRLHRLGGMAAHERELSHLDTGVSPNRHSTGIVEVQLVQYPDDVPRVVLFVSECQGADCDPFECMSGDGNSVEMTADEARTIVARLSHALSVLDADPATLVETRALAHVG